jgi:hypothetical protein
VLGNHLSLGPGEVNTINRRLSILADRMTALLGRIEADIWSGHHREVIGELDVLYVERPDDVTVPRLLATSLYLSERLAEASLVCQQAIIGLQEHGLDPGPMAELQRDVLNQTLPRRGQLAA